MKRMTFKQPGSLDQWNEVMKIDIVSSEESDGSDEEVLIVHPLPWRSEKVDRMFKRLDNKLESEKTAQCKCQSKRRVLSTTPSGRAKPEEGFPRWVFKDL